jgi:hypothetical protein
MKTQTLPWVELVRLLGFLFRPIVKETAVIASLVQNRRKDKYLITSLSQICKQLAQCPDSTYQVGPDIYCLVVEPARSATAAK